MITSFPDIAHPFTMFKPEPKRPHGTIEWQYLSIRVQYNCNMTAEYLSTQSTGDQKPISMFICRRPGATGSQSILANPRSTFSQTGGYVH